MMNRVDLVTIASALREAYTRCNGTHEREAIVRAVGILADDIKTHRYPKLDKDWFIALTIPDGGSNDTQTS